MTDCIHYWKVDSENHGICCKCGSEKEFDSFGPNVGSPWERNKSNSSESTDHVFSVLLSKGEQDDY